MMNGFGFPKIASMITGGFPVVMAASLGNAVKNVASSNDQNQKRKSSGPGMQP